MPSNYSALPLCPFVQVLGFKLTTNPWVFKPELSRIFVPLIFYQCLNCSDGLSGDSTCMSILMWYCSSGNLG